MVVLKETNNYAKLRHEIANLESQLNQKKIIADQLIIQRDSFESLALEARDIALEVLEENKNLTKTQAELQNKINYLQIKLRITNELQLMQAELIELQKETRKALLKYLEDSENLFLDRLFNNYK